MSFRAAAADKDGCIPNESHGTATQLCVGVSLASHPIRAGPVVTVLLLWELGLHLRLARFHYCDFRTDFTLCSKCAAVTQAPPPPA
jgi:hypothetical protein